MRAVMSSCNRSTPWRRVLGCAIVVTGFMATAVCAAPAPDACASLRNGVDVRVERIKSIEADARKAQSAPPPNLARTFEDMPPASDVGSRVAEERRTLEVLNGMLKGSGCQPVDIEFELAQPVRKLAAPAGGEKITRRHSHKAKS
jgi:hypothetical protein